MPSNFGTNKRTSRQILNFGVGCLILGVSAVIHYIVFLAKQLDYAIYEKDKE